MEPPYVEEPGEEVRIYVSDSVQHGRTIRCLKSSLSVRCMDLPVESIVGDVGWGSRLYC